MKRILIALSLLISLPLFFSNNLAADDQRRNAQVGDIELEQEEVKNPIIEASEHTVAYFQKLEERVKTIDANPGAVEAPSDEIIHYLTGVYLYCTVNNGTCPLPLHGLYEVDLINSKISGKPECPALTKFWTQWIRGGMEERQQYLVKTGFLGSTTDFSKNVRPQYIKCQDTITKDFSAGAPDTKEFLKARYAGGQSVQAGDISKLRGLLELIKEKKINVFQETGALKPKEKEAPGSTPKGGAKPGAAGAPKAPAAPPRPKTP